MFYRLWKAAKNRPTRAMSFASGILIFGTMAYQMLGAWAISVADISNMPFSWFDVSVKIWFMTQVIAWPTGVALDVVATYRSCRGIP